MQHSIEECAGPTRDTRNDFAAALGGVETSATGLLERTIFEHVWSCQPSFSTFLQFQHQAVIAESLGALIQSSRRWKLVFQVYLPKLRQ